MKAVVCRDGDLEVADLAAPRPGEGQILLNVSRCGICGSDLHLRVHGRDAAEMAQAMGYGEFSRAGQGIVFGHEFSGEIVDYGPGTQRRWKRGTGVVAMPLVRDGKVPQLLGASVQVTGGYAEQIVVEESMTFPVPSGFSTELAALTEPMAVGWHAVQRSRIDQNETAFVVGCGPIGLAVVAMLKAAGVRTVVASDLSAQRRDLAARCGADIVVDPNVEDVFGSGPPRAATITVEGVEVPNAPWGIPVDAATMNSGFEVMEKLRRDPDAPWWELFRTMHALNKGPSGPVVFECVGIPGMIDRLVADVPLSSRIVVVGACMEPDRFTPQIGLFKELDIRFSVGYSPGEFRDTLHMIADGKVDPVPFITGTVGLSGVDAAFTALGNPQHHAKILIDPTSPIASI